MFRVKTKSFNLKFVAFKECGLHNLTNDSSALISCKDYLKNSTINTNLTIIDQIETPKLSQSNGANLFLTSEWNLLKPFVVRKGYVPLLRRFSSSSITISNKNDSASPDYFCLYNKITDSTNFSLIFNLTSLTYLYTDKNIYTNFIINFVFNNPNQTVLSNYTLNYSYKTFGSFPINVFTLFGGNLLSLLKSYINVQRIERYPFREMQINQFDFNCSLLNDLRLDCTLIINISNYANSFQQITIDYGDGISYESFRINPYCIKSNFKRCLSNS